MVDNIFEDEDLFIDLPVPGVSTNEMGVSKINLPPTREGAREDLEGNLGGEAVIDYLSEAITNYPQVFDVADPTGVGIFRTPEDRKPTGQEIKRYSVFLKKHISIINPKIVILMGSSAMEAVASLNSGISNERGKWKEIILKNKTFPLMITFSPSYLIRFPENKKYSWEDLKKIKDKIQDLKIQV